VITATMAREGDSTGDLLAAALAHAQRGWHVFPLRPGGKRPALHGEDRCPRSGPCREAHQGWEQRATTDPRRIAACWRDGHGRHNIGIACGPSGLVVIDLDTPKDGAATPPGWAETDAGDGAGVFARLCQQHGQPWPVATFTVATPAGWHLYFADTPGQRLRNTAGRLGWCIDTRATGGYVVAPGSIIAGRRYAVVLPAPPARLPTWLTTRLADPAPSFPAGPPTRGVAHPGRYAQAALDRECQRVAQAPEGRRNDTLNRAAFALGQLTTTGLVPTALAYAELFDAACQADLDHDPGCGRRGIDRTIRSGMSAGARNARRRAA
jgi:Bifunctional DNA primase/polymerase, N-terminal